MADYAANYTWRYVTEYRSRTDRHTFTLRLARGSTLADLITTRTLVTDFLAALAPDLDNTWAVLGATYAEEDSDIFLPTTAPTSPTVSGNGTDTTFQARSLQARIEGRGLAGSKGGFTIFGLLYDISQTGVSDFRVSAAEEAAWDAAYAELIGTSAPIVAIDNSSMQWRNYLNVKHNDHYVNKLRSA